MGKEEREMRKGGRWMGDAEVEGRWGRKRERDGEREKAIGWGMGRGWEGIEKDGGGVRSRQRVEYEKNVGIGRGR